MAESAVSFLLNKLAPFLLEEVNLLSGVQEEVEYVRAEFERMTAFLRAADAMEESEPEDSELRVWLRQVRDVAYNTEDVLDEFTLRLAHNNGHGFYGFLGKISWFIKTLKARNQIAYEIKAIRSKVRDIGQQRSLLNINITVPHVANNVLNVRQGDERFIEEAELVGIENPKQDLIQLLINGVSTLKVVSVVGMGGLGKTTLVRKVYDDAQVKQLFQKHAWITVSQSFKVEELLKDLIQQLHSEIRQSVPQGLEFMNTQSLKVIINGILRKSRYLLVLDDVWSTDAWDSVKHALPKNNYGSRVMLTTRNGDVASTSCMEFSGHVYNLKHLSTEDSWTLFCRKTFPDGSCPPHLEGLSRSILARLGELPLAIVAMSGVLATKSLTDEWEMVNRSLGALLEDSNKLRNLKIILSLSYNDLPYYLKSCFLYLSIFPEDHLIESIRVIRLWIAEGYVKVRAGRTLEEVAEIYLNELLNRSLIQAAGTASDGRVRKCHVHDLISA